MPNITGTFGYVDGTDNGNVQSAFTYSNYANGVGFQSSGARKMGTINYSAAKSNAIYGASSTVQPPAIALIPQIKY